MNNAISYPGEECGLSENEWVLEQLVDEIKEEGTLIAIGKIRHLLEYFNIETDKITAEWFEIYKSKLKV